ncbi:MAG: glycerophosphodiester phosphodiesterase family protein [Firmicutes bacterium]|nr:glycerophosphodiester phosphodiesterase family protein [Bacillota bacterium]
MKKIASMCLTLLIFSVLLVQAPAFAETIEEDNISEISLINVGDFFTLKKGELKNLECDSSEVTWTTSNRKVAIVDSEGNVKALKNGKAVITCALESDPLIKDTVSISVGTKVTSIAIKEKNEFIKVGTVKKVSYSVYPKKASNKSLVWESSNPDVLVTGPGNTITALSVGTATVTCKSTDGTEVSASYEYTVYDIPTNEECTFLAHRGDMQSAPENSIPAFQSAIDRGYKYIEFDIQQSSADLTDPEDPLIIVMHDTTLKRMTGKKGNVCRLTRANISKYKITKGKNIKKLGKRLPIPTVEDALDVMFSADREVVPCIHFKEPLSNHPGFTREGIQKVLNLCKGHKIKILCRNIDDLRTISELNDSEDVELWVSSMALGQVNVEHVLDECQDLDIKGITFSQKNLLAHPEFIKQAHDRGCQVDVFGIANMSQYLKFKKMGVDRMTCNVKIFQDAKVLRH